MERRRHGRLRTDLAGEIFTALGPVMDLSRSGMRVCATDRPPLKVGQKCSLEVRCGDIVTLLPVRVMRVRDMRDGATDLGLEFRELDDQQRRALGMLARMAVNTADPTRPSGR